MDLKQAEMRETNDTLKVTPADEGNRIGQQASSVIGGKPGNLTSLMTQLEVVESESHREARPSSYTLNNIFLGS